MPAWSGGDARGVEPIDHILNVKPRWQQPCSAQRVYGPFVPGDALLEADEFGVSGCLSRLQRRDRVVGAVFQIDGLGLQQRPQARIVGEVLGPGRQQVVGA